MQCVPTSKEDEAKQIGRSVDKTNSTSVTLGGSHAQGQAAFSAESLEPRLLGKPMGTAAEADVHHCLALSQTQG